MCLLRSAKVSYVCNALGGTWETWALERPRGANVMRGPGKSEHTSCHPVCSLKVRLSCGASGVYRGTVRAHIGDNAAPNQVAASMSAPDCLSPVNRNLESPEREELWIRLGWRTVSLDLHRLILGFWNVFGKYLYNNVASIPQI